MGLGQEAGRDLAMEAMLDSVLVKEEDLAVELGWAKEVVPGWGLELDLVLGSGKKE